MSDNDTVSFRAILAPIESPVKPTKDFNPKTSERRTRIILEAFLEPGLAEMLLLLGEDHHLQITITQIPTPPSRSTLY